MKADTWEEFQALPEAVRNDVLELEASVPARQANELKVSQPVRFAAAGRQLLAFARALYRDAAKS